MRLHRIGMIGAALAGMTTLAACGSSSSGNATATTAAGGAAKPAITIGAFSFSESEVLAYVYADALKADGFSVNVKPSLGQREVVEPALDSGQISMVPEYLGNYLVYLNPKVGVLTVDQTYSTLQPLVAAKGLTLGAYSRAADADAVAVTQANATKYGLKSISDLSKVASGWTFGGPAECQARITCYAGLKQFYGLDFKGFKALDDDGPITRSALKNGDVQAARIFSSDADIASDHFVVLADPKDFQGAGNVVPVLRKAVATPEALNVVNKVSAALTTADLVQFNTDVGTNHDDATAVASDFVKAHNL
ncbi:ABC transporter substrate-binding protein [Acidiferrimicrobium sp. IK]|uniref:ABC transporter substrate-binding protein n=1 Tax=Acidiferrimicrobium sp. IK TaxID=2871700 RepID=UPI0021CAE7AB|nr:ABC transporter substrate-binding protein [Acidiferrimicrobium sp. IK]MCU4183072.1 ABC transporter substrate-binding protein [Acidiferrimicrobium sp. IK]